MMRMNLIYQLQTCRRKFT